MTDEAVRILCSYHDSEIQKHREAIGYHEQMRALVLQLAGTEEVTTQVQAIYLGSHRISNSQSCHIEGVHYHGPDPTKFYRPDKGTHWKIDGQCRIIVNHDGGWLNCEMHK